MIPAGANGRPDASMTLIREMLERPLDPGYAAAARRRTAQGQPAATSLRAPLVIVTTCLLGLLMGLASSAIRGTETTKSQARAQLVAEIEQRQDAADALTARTLALRGEVTALENTALEATSPATRERLETVSVAAGAVEVRGPAFVVTLDDAPKTDDPSGADANPRTSSGNNDGKVISRDVQIVANSLWEAGAEAISINGQRLTATSAIRFAGDAILVDYRPLARPYVITAIGQPGQLPATFADGSGGTYLSTLTNSFGIKATTAVRDTATVPASSLTTLRYAVPLTGAPSAGPTPGGSR